MTHQLAQLNIARLKFPLESVEMQDFVAALEPVNAAAEASPGFVWRLRHLRARGPGPSAFTFGKLFDPPVSQR